MQRIVIVYNPRSSKALRVRQEVIAPAQKMGGLMVGKYEVLPTSVEDNAEKLAGILQDDDLVISAGGDGTALIALNGVMLSTAKNVRFSAVPYGNFNDTARMLGMKNFSKIMIAFKEGDHLELWPMEAKIDGKFYRYAASYFTVGMFAESTEVFDKPSTRGSLRKGNKSFVYSVWQLVKWYFKHRKTQFLPDGAKLNDVKLKRKTTDVILMNGKTAARVMRGKKTAFSHDGFLISIGRLSSLFRLGIFMMRSMLFRIPSTKCEKAVLEFEEPFEVEIQAEGEYSRILLRELQVKQAKKSIKVI